MRTRDYLKKGLKKFHIIHVTLRFRTRDYPYLIEVVNFETNDPENYVLDVYQQAALPSNALVPYRASLTVCCKLELYNIARRERIESENYKHSRYYKPKMPKYKHTDGLLVY